MKNISKMTMIAWCLGIILLPMTSVTLADDIDIYQNNSAAADSPNVLIILDNSSSWGDTLPETAACPAPHNNTKFCNELQVLQQVIDNLNNKVNVGLMMFTDSPNKGGYVRYAIRPMDTDNRNKLKEIIAHLDKTGDQSATARPFAKTMFEAYKYFGGGTGTPGIGDGPGTTAYVGALEVRRDYNGNNPILHISGTDLYTAGDFPNNAFRDSSDTTYETPISSTCAKNYIIFIANRDPINDVGADVLLEHVGGSVSLTPVNNSGGSPISSSWADEFARLLYRTDVNQQVSGSQNIITYTIGVYRSDGAGGYYPDMIKLLQSMALQGGGKYFAGTDAGKIKDALSAIFSEILAVNSIFASASLPINSNVQGTYLNQIYMGVFRPDADASPLWPGNLKEYQFAYNETTGMLYLADAFGSQVDSSTTGFVIPKAISFWTADSNFWKFKEDDFAVAGNGSSSNCGTTNGGPASDCPDGPWVEKGGAAQRLRTVYPGTTSVNSPTKRPIYICDTSGGPCTAGSTLSTLLGSLNCSLSSVLTALGVANQTECESLIKWIQGEDNNYLGENAPYENSLIDVRPSVHADVLHSQPVVIDFDNSTGVWVFYGSNDGILHAVKGGQAACASANSTVMPPAANTCPGTEQWGFIPSEFLADQQLKRLKRLRDQTLLINMPSVPGSSNNKPYFMDGPIGLYRLGSTVYIFPTMRRGGRSIYALDVSDPTNAPKVLWHKSNSDTGFSELGQTWSKPIVTKLGASSNVLVFGAGYDAAVEDGVSGATRSMGRGIFILNMTDGSIIKSFGPSDGIEYSIPGNVSPVDTDGDGYADRFYAADTGGNIWRIKYANNTWSIFKLAALGGTGSNARKFLFGPDVIPYDKSLPKKYAVLIGSGDREKPSNTTITNRFYMVIDDGNDNLINESLLADTSSSDSVTLTDTQKGWYMSLKTGEKVTGESITVAGKVVFGTNRPTPFSESCTGNLGEARRYAVNYKTAKAADILVSPSDDDKRSQIAVGGGFLPSPVAGKIQIKTGDNTIVTHVFIMDNPANPGGVMKVKINLNPDRSRIYWYKEKID